MKKIKAITITVISLLVIIFITLFVYIMNVAIEREKVIRWPAIGSKKWDNMQKLSDRTGSEWKHVYAGEDFESKGQIALAAVEYANALQIAKGGVFEFSIRQMLARTLEKNGQLSEALEQIDWMLAQSNLQPRLIDNLTQSRNRIQRLRKEKNNRDGSNQ